MYSSITQDFFIVAGPPAKDKCDKESDISFEIVAHVLVQLGRYTALITVIIVRLGHDISFF